MHSTPALDEWWQLYDYKTKNFYYYNVKKQITTWNKPNDFQTSSNSEHIILNSLTSNIIRLLKDNINCSNRVLIDDIINKINDQNDEKNDLNTQIISLIREINSKTNKIVEKKNSISVIDKPGRRIQPRTNPNYVNVDMIRQNKAQIKNTYIKVDDLNLNRLRDDLKISKNNSNSLHSISRSFIILLALLRDIQVKNNSKSNSILTKLQKQKNPNQSNLVSSLSSILNDSNQSIKLDAQSFSNVNIYKSSSLTNKDKEKGLIKASTAVDFGTKSEKLNSHEETNQNLDNDSCLSINFNESFNKNNKFSRSYKLEKSIDNPYLTNGKYTNKKHQENNIYNSISATSITDIRNMYQHKNSEFNLKFQTLRRSLNNKINSKKYPTSYSESKKNICENSTTCNEFSRNDNDASLKFDFDSIESSPSQKQNKINISHSLNQDIDSDIQPENTSKSNFSFFSKKKDQNKEILIWSNQTIQKPLIKTQNKIIKKEACELFKLIQIYMGDRKLMNNFSDYLTPDLKPYFVTQKHGIFNSFTSSKNQASNSDKINFKNLSQRDVICLEIIKKGWTYNHLRDELFLQIIKQTSSNLNVESFMLGWQLMAICLSFFPPSIKLYSLMNDYIQFHSNELNIAENIFSSFNTEKEAIGDTNSSILSKKDKKSLNTTQPNLNLDYNEIHKKFKQTAQACYKRLQKINITGAKKGLKSPLLEEVMLSKNTISTPSLFGTSLEEIMKIQKRKFPHLTLPWIQTTLSEAVIRLDGAKIEGIFRVPGDLDEVNSLKVRLDHIWCSLEENSSSTNDFNINSIGNITDPHLPASLLKLWYRELYEPLIPNEFYNKCIENCDKPENCIKIVESLPEINRLVFTYLIRFLKIFAQKEYVSINKMDASNLSMIMAPNCLRCNSDEAKVIMENTKKEMQFIKTLIEYLDTSSIDGIK